MENIDKFDGVREEMRWGNKKRSKSGTGLWKGQENKKFLG